MTKGLELAVPFALMRGHVMVFVPSLLNLAEFMITGNGLFVMVRVRLARKLSAGIADIEAEFSDAIAGLRLVPRTGPVTCELWLYSRYGTLRHFRVEDAGLVEIDCYGTPLDQIKTAGALPAPDNSVGSQGTAAAGPGVASTAEKRGPILRWLAKWNAARKAGGAGDPTGSCELKKILDAGGPDTKKKRASGKKPVRKDPLVNSPADPEKDPGPGKPVAGTGASVPEEKTGPGRMRPDEHPPSPAVTLPALTEDIPGDTPGLTELSREGGKI